MQRWRPDGKPPEQMLSSRNTHVFCFFLILKRLFQLTSSKRHVGKLLPCSRVVVEVAVGPELQPLLPGVVQAVVDGRGDADLVAHGDGVSSCRLGWGWGWG